MRKGWRKSVISVPVAYGDGTPGEVKIGAEITPSGRLAVHLDLRGPHFSITHVPTGARIPREHTAEQARKVAAILDESPVLDKMPTVFRKVPQKAIVRKFQQAYEAALEASK